MATPKKEKDKKGKVTEQVFDTVHVMQENGTEAPTIAKALNLSESTIAKILRFEQFEQYREWNREYYGKEARQKREEEKTKYYKALLHKNEIYIYGPRDSDEAIARQFCVISSELIKLARLFSEEMVCSYLDCSVFKEGGKKECIGS